jgi:hypothetical protein
MVLRTRPGGSLLSRTLLYYYNVLYPHLELGGCDGAENILEVPSSLVFQLLLPLKLRKNRVLTQLTQKQFIPTVIQFTIMQNSYFLS